MIGRYTRDVMGRLWTEGSKYERWLDVENFESAPLPADAVEGAHRDQLLAGGMFPR